MLRGSKGLRVQELRGLGKIEATESRITFESVGGTNVSQETVCLASPKECAEFAGIQRWFLNSDLTP